MQCGIDLRVAFIFMLWIIPSVSSEGGPEMLLTNITQHTGAGGHSHDQAPPSSTRDLPLALQKQVTVSWNDHGEGHNAGSMDSL